MSSVTRFQSLVSPATSIQDAIALMGSCAENKFIAGIVVLVDEARQVLGVLTDGDIRRGIAKGIGLEAPVAQVANMHPLVLNRSLSAIHMRRKVIEEARKKHSNYMKYDRLVLVDDAGRFYDVIRLSDIMETQVEEKAIAVYGLGFVGLTLACTLANSGLMVIGVDTNRELVAKLKDGIAPFYEKGLDSMLSLLKATQFIHFESQTEHLVADVHIVSVGSPVDANGAPDLSHIKQVSATIAGILKAGDLVIFRSTVPVGTMRQVVLPILEHSGLVCGQDFHLAFAPERTVEGNALEELRILPQIVGGYNRTSRSMAAKLFRYITNTIIEVNSLEEAEMVKLMNNSFRDLVFAFANEAAGICEAFNINAFSVIRAANEGYPRDKIPLPSPGVGGICLSKDPFLYSAPHATLSHAPILGKASRSVNSRGAEIILGKLEQFGVHIGKPLADMSILIVGLAFKGMPETSDIRASVALDVIEKLPNRARIQVKDFVVHEDVIRGIGCSPAQGSIAEAMAGVDVVLFMNNHYLSNKFNVVDAMQNRQSPLFFFDGWNMFHSREIEAIPYICYSTMGYMSPAFLQQQDS